MIAEEKMFFNGKIIIAFHSFPSECRNSQVLKHYDFKMTLSFVIICSIAATTLKFVNMIDLSLNVKKLLILHLVWKANLMLQYRSLFFNMQLIIVHKWRGNLPKFGRAITKSFLGTVLTYFGASISV